jgi:NAD(P)H-dependent flavin oxidoreductase YrpB (nitropropane dioxygenase family)
MLREGLAMRKTYDLSYGQMLMAANTPMLLRAAMVEGSLDFGVFASGQVVGVIDDLPTVAEVVERIMKEAEATLGKLAP